MRYRHKYIKRLAQKQLSKYCQYVAMATAFSVPCHWPSLAVSNSIHSSERTLMDDSIRHNMHELHQQKQSNADLRSYVVNMQRQGTWGTDQEIVAAANLFRCSIICYSKYSSAGQFCLQHFPPHFPTMPHCTSTCCHPSLYLINSSGYHYESAIVRLSTNDMQQIDVEP